MNEDYFNPYEENEAFYERQPKSDQSVEVAFVNGPYDGHSQRVPHVAMLQRQVCLPVGPGVFDLLDGKVPTTDEITSIAIYQLYPLEEGYRYMFCKADEPRFA